MNNTKLYNLMGALIVLTAIGTAMFLIYKLNCKFAFNNSVDEMDIKIKIAAVIAFNYCTVDFFAAN